MRRLLLALLAVLSGCYIERVQLLCPTPDAPACAGDETSTGDASSSGTEDPAASETDTTASASSSTDGPSETTSTGSTTGTSTGEGPVCGNGVVEGAEECDGEANCSGCLRDRVVFVTSAVYQGDDIGGLDGADALCRGLAVNGGLANGPSFRAWLSSTTEDPAARFYRHEGRYVLVNGLVVANSWDELVSGQLQNPINATETSEVYQGSVWTGTLPDGTRHPDSGQCTDWTSGAFKEEAYVGKASSTDVSWSMAGPEFVNPISCTSMEPLYCFEQE